MVVNTLKQWKLACPAGELVFPNDNGGVKSHGSFLQHTWEPLLRRWGLPAYNFHSLEQQGGHSTHRDAAMDAEAHSNGHGA